MTTTNNSHHVCLKCRRRLCRKWQQTSSDHVLMKRGISLCPKSWQRNSSDHVGTGGRLNKPWNLTLHYLLFGGALEPQSYTSPGTFTLFFGWRNPASPEVHKTRNLTLHYFFSPGTLGNLVPFIFIVTGPCRGRFPEPAGTLPYRFLFFLAYQRNFGILQLEPQTVTLLGKKGKESPQQKGIRWSYTLHGTNKRQFFSSEHQLLITPDFFYHELRLRLHSSKREAAFFFKNVFVSSCACF